MKQLLFLACFMVLPSLAGQAAERPVRELPSWLVYSYHYGVGPVTTLASLFLRAAWFPIKTTGQVAWDDLQLIWNNPREACFVIPSHLFIAYAFHKMAQAAKDELRKSESIKQFNKRIMQFRVWRLNNRYTVKENEAIKQFVKDNQDLIIFLKGLDTGVIDQDYLNQNIAEYTNIIQGILNSDNRLPELVTTTLSNFIQQQDKKDAAHYVLSSLFTINNNS